MFSYLGAELEAVFVSLHSKAFPSLVFFRGDLSGALKGGVDLGIEFATFTFDVFLEHP